MREGPDPRDQVYKRVASTLLTKMREVCKHAREECNELEETWPKEMRIHPVHPGMAEGVLYVPRAAQGVYLFQAVALEDDVEDPEEVNIVTNVFAPATTDILHLGIDYIKRADYHMHTCVCGHVIPQFHHIPIAIDVDIDEEMALSEEEERDIRSAEDVRLSEIKHELESEYACPACGYKPNKRYG